jgi:biotin synthase
METANAPKEGKAPAAAKRWATDDVEALLALPFPELIYQAQTIHRQHFDPAEVQLSTLLSIKTGGCPEDCGYCPQSARHQTGVADEDLLPIETVVDAARAAKENGATRFCMGAAWRGPKARDIDRVAELVRAVKALGLETCATLGMLKSGQAEALKAAGLDYYNHNLDTAPEFYGEIIGTRTYEDRLDTLERVRGAGLHVCCGGIVGMGESRRQRAALIGQLANLDPYPESVPINNLVQVEGTPLEGTEALDPFEFIRTIACARITMPTAYVRLSAGREAMSEAVQALCFLAGANSIFYGEKLLTTGNPEASRDQMLFAKLGLRAAG